MANRRYEPVSYRPFRAEALLADGLLAVARPGGDLERTVADVFFGLAQQTFEIGRRGVLADAAAAGERAGFQQRPNVEVTPGQPAPAAPGRPRASSPAGGARAASEIQPAGNHRTTAAAILRKEEGFRPTPYWDVNAFRTGYGSDTITRADGSVVRVAKGMQVNRDEAELDLARRLGEFERTAAGQVGAENWNRLPDNVRGALLSVTYNYGSLPRSVVSAAQSGDSEAIAGAVGGLSANKARRQREAAIIRGGAAPAGGAPAADATIAASGGFSPMAGNNAVSRAYNEAGARTYLRMLESEMVSTTSQLYELHGDDPVALERGFRDLKGVMLREHVFDQIAPDFELGYTRLAEGYMAQARTRMRAKIEAQERAEFVEGGAALSTSLQRDLAGLDPESPGADRVLADGLSAIDRFYDEAADRGVIAPDAAARAKGEKRNELAGGFYLRQAEALDGDGVAALRETLQADFAAGGLSGVSDFAGLDAKLVALEGAKRRDATAAATKLEKAGTALAERVAGGFDVDTAALVELEVAAAGSPDGPAVVAATRAKIAAAEAIRDLPPEQARAHVEAMREALGNNPSDQAIETYEFARKKMEAVDKAIEADPLGHAQDTGRIELVPLDPSSPEKLNESFAARREQAMAVAALYGSPTLLFRPGEVKALKADLDSMDPRRFGGAMSQLDLVAQQGGLEQVRDLFGDKAVERVQDWQARLRYASPDETAQWLKDRADPRWQDRVKPLVTAGEKEARKVAVEDLVADFDEAWFSGPAAPLDPDTVRMLQADFVQVAGERYAATQDAGEARAQAVEQLKRRWGTTGIYGQRGGRLMPYPPEKFYPAVGGSHDWMATELAGVAASRGVDAATVSLVADGKTKAAADAGESTGYLLSVVDPETGLAELVTDEQGRPLRHYFDFPGAVQKAAGEAAEARRTQHDPWLVINENTAIGPFYPPWRPATEADMDARAKRIKEIAAGKGASREERKRRRQAYRELFAPTREKE
jgi:GH24 family phage-related lysozyme (muramidase)